MKRLLTSLLLAILTTALIGCPGAEECVTAGDCFAGEVCVSGVCGTPPDEQDTGDDQPDAGTDDSGTSNGDDTGNAGDGGSQVEADVGANDGGGDDGGVTGPACVVDPFDACTDDSEDPNDSNETWADAYPFADGSVGCKDSTSRDTVFALDQAQTGRKCHLETADWYRLTVVPCETKTLRMEVRLDPDESHLACPVDLAQLGLKYGGGDLDCNGDRYSIDCSTDGDQTIVRMLLPPDSTVHSFQFAATQPEDRDDVQYDYSLNVSVSE